MKWATRVSWGERPKWAFFDRVYRGADMHQYVDNMADYLKSRIGAPDRDAVWAFMADFVRARQGWARWYHENAGIRYANGTVHRNHRYSGDLTEFLRQFPVCDRGYAPNGVSGYAEGSTYGSSYNLKLHQNFDSRSILSSQIENGPGWSSLASEKEMIMTGDRMLTWGRDASLTLPAEKCPESLRRILRTTRNQREIQAQLKVADPELYEALRDRALAGFNFTLGGFRTAVIPIDGW